MGFTINLRCAPGDKVFFAGDDEILTFTVNCIDLFSKTGHFYYLAPHDKPEKLKKYYLRGVMSLELVEAHFESGWFFTSMEDAIAELRRRKNVDI